MTDILPLLIVLISNHQKPSSLSIFTHLPLLSLFLIALIGSYSYHIGNKEEFLYRRLAIQAAVQRAQRAAAYTCAANGKKRKYKAVTRYKGIEQNYVEHRLHVYSRRLIDLCIKHGAATLVLVGQQEKEQLTKEHAFLLRNWSFAALKEKIMYKAQKVGITALSIENNKRLSVQPQDEYRLLTKQYAGIARSVCSKNPVWHYR